MIYILIVLFIILSLRVSIYLNKSENTEIWLKIGLIFKFRIRNQKLLEICDNLSNYNFSNFLKNKSKNSILQFILKEVTVDQITLINENNILNPVWNVLIPLGFNILNIYVDDILDETFKKVNNKYYSISYQTVGTYKLKFEVYLKAYVYNLLIGSIIYLVNKGRKKYE